MMKLILATIQALLLAAALFCPEESEAGEAPEQLVSTILSLDRVLFDQGFNNCDVDASAAIVSESLEFYHDQSGITQGREAFLESIRNNICSLDYRPRRELLPGSTEIYALRDNGEIYGAVQRGIHRFHAVHADGSSEPTSVARFTHVWLARDGEWKLARVLSFDHQPPGKLDAIERGPALPDNRIRLIDSPPSRAF